MNYKTMLLIFASTTYAHTVCPFTFQIEKIITTDNKKITFLADAHNKSAADKEHTLCLLKFLQQNEESTHTDFHILLEQASLQSKSYSSAYQLLFRLDGYIAQAQPPLTYAYTENVEIRHIESAASIILESDDPYALHKQYQYSGTYNSHVYNSQKTMYTITFQDIVDEFNTNKEALANYFKTHPNKSMATIYANHMQFANDQYEQFQQKLTLIPDLSITIFDHAKKQYRYNGLQANKELAETMSEAFLHLLDLHILQTILTSKSNNIIVIAGGYHTSNIIPMLTDHLNATSIFRNDNNNFDLIDVKKEDGSTEQMLQQSPITIHQMMQGLSDNPDAFIPEYNTHYFEYNILTPMCGCTIS